MKNRPAYSIGSVDSALLLATLLQQEGAMRVTDVAARLGVSVSTAHRLLGMLVYRDFAEQLPDRRYATGPVRRRGPVQQASVATLRDVALPHLRKLVEAVGETTASTLSATPTTCPRTPSTGMARSPRTKIHCGRTCRADGSPSRPTGSSARPNSTNSPAPVGYVS